MPGTRRGRYIGLAAAAVLACLIAGAAAAQESEPEPPPRLLGFIPEIAFNEHLYAGFFQSPRALAFDREHKELWVADSGNDIVSIHRPDGIELFAFTATTVMREPGRIAIGRNGRIYILEGNRGAIRVFNYRGEYKGDIDLSAVGPKPVIGAVGVDADGLIYVADNASAQIFVLTPEGRLRHVFGSRGEGEGQFLSICGIAFGPDRNIYVADQQAIAVQVFDYQGNFIRGWGTHEMGGENVSLPSGIAVEPKGEYVYLSDELRHQVKVYTTKGEYLWGIGENGDAIGQFKYPTDVASDGDGRMYVVERYTSRVQVFRPVYGQPQDDDGPPRRRR